MRYTTKVAGVTFPNMDGTNRQDILQQLHGTAWREVPCRLEPEPDNQYDPNAIRVVIAMQPGTVQQVGYVPKNLAAIVAPHLQGEAVIVQIVDVNGGFENWRGEVANYGMQIDINLPDEAPDYV